MQKNKIKTRCDQCSNYKDKCELGFDQFVEELMLAPQVSSSKVFTEGFCRYINKTNPKQDITIIIYFTSLNKLQNAVDNLKDKPHKIILFLENFDKPLMKECIKIMQDSGLDYKIETIVEQEFKEFIYIYDWCLRLIDTTFFGCFYDFTLDETLIRQFDETFPRNTVWITLDQNEYIIATEVFRQMKGNQQIPIVDKIKSFDNWRNVCLILR